MEHLAGKTAVITGAASGIGRALALAVAAEGMRLCLADVEAGPLEAVVAEARAAGAPDAFGQTVDVADRASVQALAEAAYARLGAVHLLVNNAGVVIGGGLESARHEDWQWVLGVNLWGVIHGVEAFVPRMIAGGEGGHVVNTASMAGLIASRGLGIYNTSKAAVVSLSETLAKDLRDHGIGVSVVCPMGVTTRIREAARNRPPELAPEGEVDDPPELLGRRLPPEQVARQIVAAVRENRLYVLTHAEGREHWDRRARRISAAFPVE